MTSPTDGLTNRLLGYPADARLLLINADDLGMCHAINEAIFDTLQAGLVRSTSVMVACPWWLHARKILQAAPDIPFGVHLTAVSEQPSYRWGPLTCRSDVPTLVDHDGYFYAESRIDELLARLDVSELEQEFRAQIELVLAAGLKPTHLDSHCAIHARSQPIFDMTLRLARQYGLALRVYYRPFIDTVQQRGLPTNDHALMDSYDVDPSDKFARYAQMLRLLPAGLSEWAVHPGIGNAELQAIEPSWRVRQTDYEFCMSPAARRIVDQEGIVLVDYRAVQALWNAL